MTDEITPITISKENIPPNLRFCMLFGENSLVVEHAMDEIMAICGNGVPFAYMDALEFPSNHPEIIQKFLRTAASHADKTVFVLTNSDISVDYVRLIKNCLLYKEHGVPLADDVAERIENLGDLKDADIAIYEVVGMHELKSAIIVEYADGNVVYYNRADDSLARATYCTLDDLENSTEDGYGKMYDAIETKKEN